MPKNARLFTLTRTCESYIQAFLETGHMAKF